MTPQTKGPDAHFTVFIRLPFPRGDFVDPLPVEWNATKDRALWEILSRPSKGDDIDWKALAESFDVTLPFLLQQAAWLYDRQLSQVRAQMRRVGTTHSTSPSPAPGSVSGSTALGGQAMKRIGSGGSRVPSRLAIQTKDISIPRAESSPVTATRNKVSAPPRTSSAATVTQVKSGREPSPRETLSARTQRQGSGVRGSSNTGRDQGTGAPPRESPVLEEDSLTSSSEEESDSEEDVSSRRAPGFKRFGKFSIHRAGLRDDEEDDDDDSPAFLPLPRGGEPGSREAHRSDLNATLRLEHQHPGAQRRETTEHVPLTKQTTMMSSASSASSGVAVGMPQESRRPSSYALGALSPQRAAHLSPRRRAAAGNDASDTPSMGSSFSDLDDASVTQSALEEALLSNMQHGGMASRMSTISQALRSRYL
ncbi:hypothetical protein Plec18167_007493 [Paecilomyces lecythidis]|uniref:Autophagy-related protein 29 n=1 Tax=Paecilomyces lecythidis TaxID=3004212 RepID=A0ABR3X3N2_9EURO